MSDTPTDPAPATAPTPTRGTLYPTTERTLPVLKFLAIIGMFVFSQPTHNTKAAGIQAAPGVNNPNYPRRASDLGAR